MDSQNPTSVEEALTLAVRDNGERHSPPRPPAQPRASRVCYLGFKDSLRRESHG